MSGIAKAFKKTLVGALKPVRKLASKATEVVKKVVKSKAFKIIAGAALIYFGGAAVMSMAGGGTASAGIGSAWGGLQGAGSALASGNVSGAFSAIGSGFTGGAAAGATGTFAAGQAAAQAAIAGKSIAPVAAPLQQALTQIPAIQNTTPALDAMKAAGKLGLDTTQQSLIEQGVTSLPTKSGGLLSSVWNGLGEAGKGAVVSSGINMAGQMIQGYSQQKQAEEAAANRDYFGVRGDGTKTNLPAPGLLNPSNILPSNPVPQLQPIKTLDDLIDRQQQTVSQYKPWGA